MRISRRETRRRERSAPRCPSGRSSSSAADRRCSRCRSLAQPVSMVRSQPHSSRWTPTASMHASSIPPSTPLPERSTMTFGARADRVEDLEPVSAAADVRQDEAHAGMARGQLAQLPCVGCLLPGVFAAPALPYVMKDRNAALRGQPADRIHQRIVGAPAGGELDPDHARVQAAPDLRDRLGREVRIDRHVAADALGVLPLEREHRVVAVAEVGRRREVRGRRVSPAAEDGRDVRGDARRGRRRGDGWRCAHASRRAGSGRAGSGRERRSARVVTPRRPAWKGPRRECRASGSRPARRGPVTRSYKPIA